jgi:hypothetical protein
MSSQAPQLKEHAFVVFVYNRWGLSIPGAEVTVLVDGQPMASATLRGYSDTPIMVHLSEAVIEVTLRATVPASEDLMVAQAISRDATIRVDVGSYAFTFKEVSMPQPENRIPSWFQPAGFACGVATLGFFMWLAATNVTQVTFAHQAVIALGMALAAAFIGGDAAAKSKIPFFKNSPIAISASGGIAVFVIVFALVSLKWPIKESPEQVVFNHVRLHGRVLDEMSKPIVGARVTVEGRPFLAETDTTGTFEGDLPTVTQGALITVRVTHEQFASGATTVAVQGSEFNLADIKLTPP